jgi:LuxR family transcriptional regulator, quorum-sensing system regulator BjaR1
MVTSIAEKLQRKIAKTNKVASRRARQRSSSLTLRETEVLAWVARGKSARAIGEILHITKRTVDAHVLSAIHKTGAANRTHAVVVAIRDGIIDV